jgi:Flp pilus assembly protein TadG
MDIGADIRNGAGRLGRRRRFRAAAGRIGADRRGATMVEFALVMLPLFILLFGIFEVGFVIWGGLELENATDDAARLVRTGRAQTENISEAQMKQEICNRVSLLSSCTSKLRIDVRNFQSFGQMTAPAPLDASGGLKDGFTYDPGGPQRVVLMTTFYEWPLLNFITAMSFSNMASGNRLLRATAAFRSEPFPES